MNIPAAIRLINNARKRNMICSDEARAEVEEFLKEALKVLQPQRYVLHKTEHHIYIVDTEHPDYQEDVVPKIAFDWVVLRWTYPADREEEKARAIVEHLNSTATPHEATT